MDAITALELAALRDPSNADIQNYIGYAYHRLRQWGPAMQHYQQALTFNRRHRGAHEHLGELYLALGEPAKAEEQLAMLEDICLIPCEEFGDLKRAIATYKVSSDSLTRARMCGRPVRVIRDRAAKSRTLARSSRLCRRRRACADRNLLCTASAPTLSARQRALARVDLARALADKIATGVDEETEAVNALKDARRAARFTKPRTVGRYRR